MSLLRIVPVVILLSPVFGADNNLPINQTLAAHEWGTFTSVAGSSGYPVAWAPLAASVDLPCFVLRLGQPNLKYIAPAFVRMETPVLYFYPQHAMTLSVHVEFPQGWITEWYPKATRVMPEALNFPYEQGRIEWDSVRVSPGEDPEFPTGKGASHYYAARNTDAAPLRIGNQQEKLIFYRGIGNFRVPVRPKFASDGALEIRNAGTETIPLAILFENRNGVTGYRITRGLKEIVKLDPPELTGNLEQLKQEMAGALVEFGLYKKEALAMIETWRDSWFEEGMRVFYIVPRPTTDSLLPLTITPSPSEIARVFVGRVEVLSPSMRQTIETALTKGDVRTLAKFGRFLDPFLFQMENNSGGVNLSPAARSFAQTYLEGANGQTPNASCVQ